MKIFSERLKAERENKKLTQKELAQALDIPYGTYKNYELLGTSNGREPSLEVICKIARYFDISVDYFLGLTD